MSPLVLNTLVHALWLCGLAQTAPANWECEDAFARCKETCSVDHGIEGIAGARLNNCLSGCLTTVKGCKERARCEAVYRVAGPAESKAWEKNPEPEYKTSEPVYKTPEAAPVEEAPPRKSPPSGHKPPAALEQTTPIPTPASPTPLSAPSAPTAPPHSPSSEGDGNPSTTSLPPPPQPPFEDDWKPWTPPPSEKKPRERERPIDEWNPR